MDIGAAINRNSHDKKGIEQWQIIRKESVKHWF